ncbi:MAG TPA: MSMEG_0565 family glycosyltransferase [Acidimicrobiales bacterium]|nr:MSMEG_0565 family glycosyltransferase [Acidimicrobiales bacterium]
MTLGPRVALVTYSTKPRGGVVHTLALAEALVAARADVTVVALGDPGKGFFRPVNAPFRIVPAPAAAETLEDRVFQSVDALEAGLSAMTGRFDVFHTQDCIAARAAARVRDAGARIPVVRTVHHVDDFTTPALVDCQRQAILEPDIVLVVSQHWRTLLKDEYGVDAGVVYNGVDRLRFGPIAGERRSALRRQVGAEGRFLFLAVGGIEPRKGSVHLLEALGRLKAQVDPSPVLAVVGGHSFQDYKAYREAALASMPALGLELGRDVVLLGTVPDEDLPAWYRAADALAFPSIKEGWGLAVLEAMAARLPVVATDIPVFREYLTPGEDALLVPPGNPVALAAAMRSLVDDGSLRDRLRVAGAKVAARFTWEAAASRHLAVYAGIRLADRERA